MRMVEESKNERLKMLLDKTNELLEGIGKAVQQQKDAEHVGQPEGFEVPKGSESEDCSQISDIKSESHGGSPSDDDADLPGSADESKFNAGRRLDSTVHSIEEKVEQSFNSHILNFLLPQFRISAVLLTIILVIIKLLMSQTWQLGDSIFDINLNANSWGALMLGGVLLGIQQGECRSSR